ncbi:MAG: SDR family NAD(P)-dependent oxidoreductase [Longimicrobiales bacterium]
MSGELTGRVALVTGASRGIGHAIARALVEAGADVLICARDARSLEQAAIALRDQGPGRAAALAADVTDTASAPRLVASCIEHYGGIDILVNNVGASRRRPIMQASDDDWREILDLNLLSGLRLARAAVPPMRERGGGSIIFIGSIWGRESGPPEQALYVVSKSAVIGAARMMALELAGDGIRVNSVAPGSIRFAGGSWDRRVRAAPVEMERWVEQNLPLGRFGRPEEVAALVVFLASAKAGLITGACVAVDGAQGHSLI